MTNTEIKNNVIRKVKELCEKFSTSYGSEVLEVPISFDIKGTTAGTFCYGYGGLKLNFNFQLLKDNYESFMNRTVPHEVAHLCCHIKYGVLYDRAGRRRIHGKEWKSINSFLGGEGSRCHSYNCDKVRKRKTQRRWSYTCDCGFDHQISTVTHNRIQRGQKSFHCDICKTTIKFVG